MTDETRSAVVTALWASLVRFAPAAHRPDAQKLVDALEGVYLDYAEGRYATGMTLGLRQGAASVEARADRRDLGDLQDAPELRSVH
jgi:hypothetical protein